MNRIKNCILEVQILKDTRGQDLIEYALVAGGRKLGLPAEGDEEDSLVGAVEAVDANCLADGGGRSAIGGSARRRER